MKAIKKTPSGPPTLTPVPVRVDTPDGFAVRARTAETYKAKAFRHKQAREQKTLAVEAARQERERERAAKAAQRDEVLRARIAETIKKREQRAAEREAAKAAAKTEAQRAKEQLWIAKSGQRQQTLEARLRRLREMAERRQQQRRVQATLSASAIRATEWAERCAWAEAYPPVPANDLSLEEVFHHVCQMGKVEPADVASRSVKVAPLTCRMLTAYIARRRTRATWRQIALLLTGHGHTAVIEGEHRLSRCLSGLQAWAVPEQERFVRAVLAAFGLGGEQTRTDSETL